MAGHQTFQNVINGKLVDAASGETYDVIDPTTGEVYGHAPDVRCRGRRPGVRRRRAGLRGVGRHHPAERQLALLKIADALEKRADEFVKTESRNTGKPLGLTTSEEVPPSIDQIRFFAGAARVLEGRSAGEYLKGHTSYVRREPIGVVGQVTPWNYPLMMMVWKIAPASPRATPSCSSRATPRPRARRCSPSSARSSCRPACSTWSAATATPAGGSSSTGSRRWSRSPARSGPAWRSRVGRGRPEEGHLELGGKAPVVVFDDADVEAAAEAIAEAGLLQRRPGLHRRHPRAGRPGRPRRLRRRPDRAGQADPTGGPTTRTSCTAPLNNENQRQR